MITTLFDIDLDLSKKDPNRAEYAEITVVWRSHGLTAQELHFITPVRSRTYQTIPWPSLQDSIAEDKVPNKSHLLRDWTVTHLTILLQSTILTILWRSQQVWRTKATDGKASWKCQSRDYIGCCYRQSRCLRLKSLQDIKTVHLIMSPWPKWCGKEDVVIGCKSGDIYAVFVNADEKLANLFRTAFCIPKKYGSFGQMKTKQQDQSELPAKDLDGQRA